MKVMLITVAVISVVALLVLISRWWLRDEAEFVEHLSQR